MLRAAHGADGAVQDVASRRLDVRQRRRLRAFVDGQQVAADASLAGTAPGTITELIVGAAYSYAESPALKVEMDNMMVLGE